MDFFTTKEIQDCCLEILKEFDRFARDNNITYYLSGGTLLGAVRHQGFIPWDDDIDLMLPRPDYEKLLKTYQDGRYQLSSCEKDSTYGTPFARLWDTETELIQDRFNERELGAFIDLFPIDGYPTNNLLAKIRIYKLKWKRAKINLALKKRIEPDAKYRIIKHLLKSTVINKNANYYCLDMNRYAKKIKYENSEYVGVTTTTVHIFLERNHRNIFKKTIYLPFEDLRLPAPSGYDVYLKHLYGDYMELPSIENRVSTHYYKIRKKTDAQ